MTELALGHALHQIDQLIVPTAEYDLAGHDFGDGRFEGGAFLFA